MRVRGDTQYEYETTGMSRQAAIAQEPQGNCGVDEVSMSILQVPEVAVIESSYASAVSFTSLVGGRGDEVSSSLDGF